MKSISSIQSLLVILLALAYCFALTVMGTKGIILLTAILLGCIFIYLTAFFSDFMLGMVIVLIGLSPFFMSARIIPGLPKLYGDNAILLYLPYLILAYTVLGKKRFSLGDSRLAICILLFLTAAGISFLSQPLADTAMRNFAETYLLGFTMYFVFLNESTEDNVDKFFRFIAMITICITIYLYFEVAFQQNYLIAKYAKLFLDEFLYLDPELHLRTDAYYRPYAVFFHPSEAGTFVSMGLPFVFHSVRNWRFTFKYGLMLFVFGGVILNYTRGVWLALALSVFFCNFSKLKRFVPVLAISGAMLLLAIYVTVGDTPFGKRIFDPANLYNRLYYWRIGLNMFVDNFPYGFGHMNFEHHYLDFTATVPPPLGLDVQQVFVADNLLLTTMVEEGLMGVIALLTLYVTAVTGIVSTIWHLRKRNDNKNSLRLQIILHAMLVYLFAGMLADVHLFAKATKLFFIIMGMAFAISTFALMRTKDDAKGEFN